MVQQTITGNGEVGVQFDGSTSGRASGPNVTEPGAVPQQRGGKGGKQAQRMSKTGIKHLISGHDIE
jgi:hypothetical protein